MWQHYTRCFPANGVTNPDVFSLKPSLKGSDPSNFQLTGVCHFGGVREQTYKQKNTLTDILLLLKSDDMGYY